MLRAALVVLALGCNKPKEATPESAVREMILMTRMGKAARAYALLAPKSQQQLEKMARLATAQTGGQRTIAPHELIHVNLDPVPHQLGRIEIVEQRTDRARVRLLSADGKAQEELNLVRVKDRWRIELPARPFEQPSPPSAPTSAPAAAPPRGQDL